MSKSFSALHHDLIQLSEPIRQSLLRAQYNPPEASNVSVKSMLESLLPQTQSPSNPDFSEAEIRSKLKDFGLCCAALASSAGSTYDQLSWIPNSLSLEADSAFRYLSKAFSGCLKQGVSTKIGELGFDLRLMPDEEKLAAELMVQVLPSLKASIKESSIDKSEDGDEVSAAVARSPVAHAIVAAYQFRWFVTQVDYPHLGRLCSLVIPCALTSLDHWSPEVKGQGMISFIHLAKNVNAAELSWYEDVILDACCQNIVSSDEIWHLAVEMSVALLTCIQPSNPRSSWIERMLSEMLSHLERQPRNKERCLAWLKHIEQLFNVVGLVLLAHFKRIFPLFFQWMYTDDDETILLVLERVHTVIKLTWIRNTPYIERLVDELANLYKEAALKIACEEIRAHILQILILLQQCKGPQFKAAWDKHKDDPNLTTLEPSLSCMAVEGDVLTAVEVIPKSEIQQHVWGKYKNDVRYQWFCSSETGNDVSLEPLPSQRSCSYKVRLEDIGRCLRCECIVTDVFGRSSQSVYAETAPILPVEEKREKVESSGLDQWLEAPDLISIPGETGRMYESNVDDVGYRLVALYTPVREDGVEGQPVSASTEPIAVEPDILKEVKQKLDLGSVKFEALCDKDRSPKKVPGMGSLERRILEVNRKRIKVVKPGSKTSFPTTEIRGSYAPPFHVELFRNEQHRIRIVVDSENEVDLLVQTRHLRDVIVLVIRGLAQRFNSTSLNSLLKIDT